MKKPNLFPFPKIRGGQKEFVDDARKVIKSGGTLIAHAPTGIGKTVAALVPALEYALENDKVVFFLTPKQSQHKIAVETLKLIKDASGVDFSVVDVISKQAMCPRDIAKEYYAVFNEICKFEQKTRKCAYFRKYDREVTDKISKEILHVEELKDLCTAGGICPHRAALDAARHTNVLICDYNYMFSDISQTILDNLNLDLEDIILVVDEAHNLPERIRNHLSDEITLGSLREAVREMRQVDDHMYRHLKGVEKWFEKFFNEFAKKGVTEENVDKESVVDGINKVLQGTLGGPMTCGEFVGELMEIGAAAVDAGEGKDRSNRQLNEKGGSTILRVAEFLDGWMSDLACSRIFAGEPAPRLYFRLLDPSVISRGVLAGAHATIIMSGTLYPTDMYADILGAEPEKTISEEYKSPFPRENRLVMVTKGLTTRYVERSEDMYKNIADKILGISNVVDGNIAVFFPSYALLESISSYVTPGENQTILTEQRRMNKRQKNRLYGRIRVVKSGGILMGVQAGSLSEGIDYEDNILKAVIIVGLPLSPPTLEVKNLEKYYVAKFGGDKGKFYSYIYPAISKVLQAGGRGIRSETDIGVIVLMDYRFAYPIYRRCLPPDYDLKITDEPERLCREFFRDIKEVIRVRRESVVEEEDEEGGADGGEEGAGEKGDKLDDDGDKSESGGKFTAEFPTALKILELIGDLEGKFGKNKIAGIIGGSKSRYVVSNDYDKHEFYGILSDIANNEIATIIDELLMRGYVASGGDPRYPTISLTREGDDAITKGDDIGLVTLSKLLLSKDKKTNAGKRAIGDRSGKTPDKTQDKSMDKPDVQEQIRDAIISVGSKRLEEVKDLLPPGISYDEIKFTRASLLGEPEREREPKEENPEELSAPLLVLALVKDIDGKLGKTKLTGILTGSRASYIYESKYDRHTYYNSLANLTQKDVAGIIGELVEREYLVKGGSRLYPVIGLTEKGRVAVSERKRINEIK